MPGPSRPDGVATRVSRPPSLLARVLTLPMVASMPPSCIARAWAASLPECISRPCSRLVDGVVAARRRHRRGCLRRCASSLVPGTILLRLSSLMRLHRGQHLDDTGRAVPRVRDPWRRSRRRCRDRPPPTTRPRRHRGPAACRARRSIPQPPIASPPTGLAGTGQRPGRGSPGLGTSEASTAGGVLTLYGQRVGRRPGVGFSVGQRRAAEQE